MAFPSKPNHADNDWIDRCIEPFKNWAYSRQPLPDMNDFSVNEDVNGVRFALRKEAIARVAAASTWPLKLVDATTGGVAKIKVLYGTVAGRPAIADMPADGYDSTLTVNGTRYIYCEVTWGYSAPIWTSSDCTLIADATASKASTATKQYVYIGNVVREDDGSGGFRTKDIFNNLTGSQGASRIAYGAIISDKNWAL